MVIEPHRRAREARTSSSQVPVARTLVREGASAGGTRLMTRSSDPISERGWRGNDMKVSASTLLRARACVLLMLLTRCRLLLKFKKEYLMHLN